MNDKEDDEEYGALSELIRELIPYAYDDGEDPPNEASVEECVEYAADEIARLRSKNAALREALRLAINLLDDLELGLSESQASVVEQIRAVQSPRVKSHD